MVFTSASFLLDKGFRYRVFLESTKFDGFHEKTLGLKVAVRKMQEQCRIDTYTGRAQGFGSCEIRWSPQGRTPHVRHTMVIGVDVSVDGLNGTIGGIGKLRDLSKGFGLAPKVRGHIDAGCRNRSIGATF